jgi:hypothetical protein
MFGPVLSVIRVDSYDEAIALVNSNPYANGVWIFTRDGGAARQFEFDVSLRASAHQRYLPLASRSCVSACQRSAKTPIFAPIAGAGRRKRPLTLSGRSRRLTRMSSNFRVHDVT